MILASVALAWTVAVVVVWTDDWGLLLGTGAFLLDDDEDEDGGLFVEATAAVGVVFEAPNELRDGDDGDVLFVTDEGVVVGGPFVDALFPTALGLDIVLLPKPFGVETALFPTEDPGLLEVSLVGDDDLLPI